MIQDLLTNKKYLFASGSKEKSAPRFWREIPVPSTTMPEPKPM